MTNKNLRGIKGNKQERKRKVEILEIEEKKSYAKTRK